MRKKRIPKETDQTETEKAFFLLYNLIQNNPQIENSLWGGAMWTALMDGYQNSGFTFEQFEHEVAEILNHYKPHWEASDE